MVFIFLLLSLYLADTFKGEEMNKEIKKQWIAALTSGKYKQGRGQLRSENNKFCCLGVLCNLHAQAYPKIAAMEKCSEEYMGEAGWLPDEVIEWAGLDSPNGVHTRGENVETLALDNDCGYSFQKIAKIIEEKF
tara:strand:+ start:15406 stop:15807 length:402 start_codon:yes stop_codon:yes gene_type:complete